MLNSTGNDASITSKRRKGVVLAGGLGTRLYPATRQLNKHLLAIYDKPMIYYPLSTLMLGAIQDILIVTTPQALDSFQQLLGDGSDWGLCISYAAQQRPAGLVDAILAAESFVIHERVVVVLGDNLFFGRGFSEILTRASCQKDGATLFAYPVGDGTRFGVVQLDDAGRPVMLEEKPRSTTNALAVTGLYYYDEQLIDFAKQVETSDRGETEITDLNRLYLGGGELTVEVLGRGFTWMDAGTHESMLDAGNYVASIEKRQGLKIACLEEIAWRRGFIDTEHLAKLCRSLPMDYRRYLESVVEISPQ